MKIGEWKEMLDKEDVITIIELSILGFLFMGAMCWVSSVFGVPFIIVW